MPREDAAWLADMLLACRKLSRYTDGMSFKKFASDERTQDAVLRALEGVGEAARNVSAETQDEHGDIPWARIVALRNRLIHGYFEINLEIVWQIATVEALPSAQQINALSPGIDAQMIPTDSGPGHHGQAWLREGHASARQLHEYL